MPLPGAICPLLNDPISQMTPPPAVFPQLACMYPLYLPQTLPKLGSIADLIEVVVTLSTIQERKLGKGTAAFHFAHTAAATCSPLSRCSIALDGPMQPPPPPLPKSAGIGYGYAHMSCRRVWGSSGALHEGQWGDIVHPQSQP